MLFEINFTDEEFHRLRATIQRYDRLCVQEKERGKAEYEQFDMEDDFGGYLHILRQIVGVPSPHSEEGRSPTEEPSVAPKGAPCHARSTE